MIKNKVGGIMVLTDKRIRELAEKNHLISPFEEDHLQSESYDVTIGTELVVMKKEIRCIDISKQDSIDDIYQNINIAKEGYIISPKEYIFMSLAENIKLPNNITAHLRPKTRYTRLGLLVSNQHCNSTYAGHLWIGLFNATEYPIRIYAGFTIAQLVFEELDGIPSEEKLYENKENAHYQNEYDVFRGANFDDGFLNSIWNKILN